MPTYGLTTSTRPSSRTHFSCSPPCCFCTRFNLSHERVAFRQLPVGHMSVGSAVLDGYHHFRYTGTVRVRDEHSLKLCRQSLLSVSHVSGSGKSYRRQVHLFYFCRTLAIPPGSQACTWCAHCLAQVSFFFFCTAKDVFEHQVLEFVNNVTVDASTRGSRALAASEITHEVDLFEKVTFATTKKQTLRRFFFGYGRWTDVDPTPPLQRLFTCRSSLRVSPHLGVQTSTYPVSRNEGLSLGRFWI